MRKSVLVIPLLSLWVSAALADPQAKTDIPPSGSAAAPTVAKGSLVDFLRSVNDQDIKEGGRQDSAAPVRYISAYQDLNGDGNPEAIVYMLGPNWCGSGGCSTFILTREDGSWTEVAEITLSYPAIYMLPGVSAGWHDLAVRVRDLRGDPTGDGYEAALRFDGKTYPRNPSVPPAQRLEAPPRGKQLIASANDASPLYDVAQAAAPSVAAPESLKAFIKTLDRYGPDKQLRYIAALHDLNGDGVPEAIVYLISRNWCGSGGCTMFVLVQKDGIWKELSRSTISRPPIYALADVSDGWHGIGVWVQGGGIQPGYEARLSFDGHSYPLNPSVPPAERIDGTPTGQVLITSMHEAKLLYDDVTP